MRTTELFCAGLAAGLLLTPMARADDGDAASSRALRRSPVVEAVEKAAPSVVSIGTKQLVQQRFWFGESRERIVPGALGSGVIVHPRGYVITNVHVINRAYEIYVKLTGAGEEETEIPAKLVAVEPEHDLALLRMEGPGPYPAANVGRSNDLMVGETVIAMGNPFGLGRTVSTGVVSAQRRSITVNDRTFDGLIQTDAAVNQGNSGGPLLNILGEWIGVNSAIYSLSGGSDGISFAIPVDTARDFLARSLQPRRVSDKWLGLEFEADARGGVKTSTVYPVGPAHDKDVPEGRHVVAVDGRTVDDLLALRLAVLDALPKGRVALRLDGADGPLDLAVTFDDLPTNELLWKHFGLECVEVTGEVADTEGYREGAGVMIDNLREGGPAERIGMKKGDLIQGFGPRTVRSLEDLLLVVQFGKPEGTYDVQLGRPVRNRMGATGLSQYNGRIIAE